MYTRNRHGLRIVFILAMAAICLMWGSIYCGKSTTITDGGFPDGSITDGGKDGGKDGGADGGKTDGGPDGGGNCGTAICEVGQECVKPDNVCKWINGQTCPASPTDCKSGICADGVCCDEVCTGSCETCNATDSGGAVGTCSATNSGFADPKGLCVETAQDTCGTNGKCSGVKGICQKWGAGLKCADAFCSEDGGCVIKAKICDGEGHCNEHGVTECDKATQQCSGAVCMTMQGKPCTAHSQCATGNCIDGYCCGSICEHPCKACNLAGSLGVCTPLPKDAEDLACCIDDSDCNPWYCERNGKCDGTSGGLGACEKYSPTTVCMDPSCENIYDGGSVESTSRYQTSYCDGTGNCITPDVEDCAPFQCDDAGTTCKTSCTSKAEDCTENADCVANTTPPPPNLCGLNDGYACTQDKDCAHRGCCLDGGTKECVNPKADKYNCNGCGQGDPTHVCADNNTTSNNCVNGVCSPVCDTNYAVCGQNYAGCDTNLSTYLDPNYGTCAKARQVGDKDGKSQDGNQTCCTVWCVWGGNQCLKIEDWKEFGDTSSYKGKGTAFFWAKALMNTGCSNDPTLHHKVTLTAPANAKYKITAYKTTGAKDYNCGSLTAIGSVEAENGGSAALAVNIPLLSGWAKDDVYKYLLKVEYVSGQGCGNWGVMLQHSVCNCCIHWDGCFYACGTSSAMMDELMNTTDQSIPGQSVPEPESN